MAGILLLFLFSFLLLGPKKTSELARLVGQQIAGLRRAASDLQAQLEKQMPPQGLSTNPDRQLGHTVVDLVTSGAMTQENELQDMKSLRLAPQLPPDSCTNSSPEIADCGIEEPH